MELEYQYITETEVKSAMLSKFTDSGCTIVTDTQAAAKKLNPNLDTANITVKSIIDSIVKTAKMYGNALVLDTHSDTRFPQGVTLICNIPKHNTGDKAAFRFRPEVFRLDDIVNVGVTSESISETTSEVTPEATPTLQTHSTSSGVLKLFDANTPQDVKTRDVSTVSPKPGSRRRWTPEELEYVKSHYLELTYEEMAEALNRTPVAVEGKCWEQGWKR